MQQMGGAGMGKAPNNLGNLDVSVKVFLSFLLALRSKLGIISV